tara:strand:+ start:509 stop:1000 length:492 start_codon:yes stop_codon:yes gene_type:complete
VELTLKGIFMAKPSTKVKGRPTEYLKVYNEQGRKLGLLGYTDKKIADFFGVSETTLNNWKNKYPSFLESLKAGKEVADMEVTASLYERAIGYSHMETKVFNNQGEILTHNVKKIYPPDPISIKYWLNNRQPETWREKVEEPMGTEETQIQKIQIEVVGAPSND